MFFDDDGHFDVSSKEILVCRSSKESCNRIGTSRRVACLHRYDR